MAKDKKWGVVPYRKKKGKLKVLLITTRNDNWGLPKGNLIKKIGARKTALREAYEEAGLVGEIKGKGKKFWPASEESIYFWPMTVEKELNRWPERNYRTRKWVKPSKALQLIKRKAYKKAIKLFAGKN
jgi:8-oxo-dGTP pyrophosphatase MutT (NUDIX family)